jgi:hypothetical protein
MTRTLGPNVRFGSKPVLATLKRDLRKTPESRHLQGQSACLKRAMCGRLRVGKSFLHVFAGLVGAAMCSAF